MCEKELEQLKGNENVAKFVGKNSRTKPKGEALIHSPSLESMKQDDTTVLIITVSFWKRNPSTFVVIPETRRSRRLQGNDGRTLISQHETRQK